MKLLITGASGFVGRSLVQRMTRGREFNLTLFNRGDLVRNYFKNFDYIIHTAAELKDESKMFQSNVQLTSELLNLAKAVGSKFIYIGSFAEYGQEERVIYPCTPYTPSSIYGITKAAGTLLCDAYEGVTIIRPFSLYGPLDNERRLFPSIIRGIKNNREISIYGGSHDWVHINDMIQIILNIINGYEILPQIIDVGTGVRTTNLELIKTCERIIGKPIKYKYEDEIKSGYFGWMNEGNKDCKTTLEQGLKELLHEFR